MTKIIYTIGHSNHRLHEFITMLKAYKINHIVDIRTIPKSRHVPWFNEKKLCHALQKEKIQYTYMPALGGLRHTTKDSINAAWRNKSFRGFADYMQTREFFLALKGLNALLKKNKRVAIMCAEAVPWRCHRSLVADAEVVRHITVFEIISKTSIRKHTLTTFAVVDRKKRPIKVYYPKSENILRRP